MIAIKRDCKMNTGSTLTYLIKAAQELLSEKFTGTNGLQHILTVSKLQEDKFVQILHIANSHWAVISNIDCLPGSINVYDSLHAELVQGQKIARIIKVKTDYITINILDVAVQTATVGYIQ